MDDVILPIIMFATTPPQGPKNRFLNDYMGPGGAFPQFPGSTRRSRLDLLSFSLVSRVRTLCSSIIFPGIIPYPTILTDRQRWGREAQELLLRHVVMSRAYQLDLLLDLIQQHQNLGARVKSVNTVSRRMPYTTSQPHPHPDGEPIDLRGLLMVCPNIKYIFWANDMIGSEWTAEELQAGRIKTGLLPARHKFSSEAPYMNVTHLWHQLYPTENTWRMLLCMPSLRQLAIGDLNTTTTDLPSPPAAEFPTFALEQLTVLGDTYQYSWILHSSANSLRHLTLHYVTEGWPLLENAADIRTALQRCGRSIRHLYLNSYLNENLTTESILRLCPSLQSFKISLTDLQWPNAHITSHRHLDGYLSSLHRTLEHLHLAYGPSGTFIDTDGVNTLVELVERHPMLQGLKRLCIGSGEPLAQRVYTTDMRLLRLICRQKGIILNTISDEEIDEVWNKGGQRRT